MAIQDKQVSDYIENNGIKYQAVYLAKIVTGGWHHFKWFVIFTNKRQWTVEIFEYSMGLGHVNKTTGKPVAPTPACVIHSLIMDSIALDQNFDDWCGDCGYDTDSRKSLSIYESCKAGAVKLKNIFSEAQLSELADMLADY